MGNLPPQSRYVSDKFHLLHEYISHEVGIIHELYVRYVGHERTEFTVLSMSTYTRTRVVLHEELN